MPAGLVLAGPGRVVSGVLHLEVGGDLLAAVLFRVGTESEVAALAHDGDGADEDSRLARRGVFAAGDPRAAELAPPVVVAGIFRLGHDLVARVEAIPPIGVQEASWGGVAAELQLRAVDGRAQELARRGVGAVDAMRIARVVVLDLRFCAQNTRLGNVVEMKRRRR